MKEIEKGREIGRETEREREREREREVDRRTKLIEHKERERDPRIYCRDGEEEKLGGLLILKAQNT